MFPLVSLSVLAVVALGPLAVLGSFKVNLSPVVQCQPVTLSFSGSDANNHSVPTTLTILPLLDNAQPINIAIPNGATNSTGIELTFIPLAAGTQFIASLDDLQGPSASASDTTVVSPSNDTADTNCAGSSPLPANFYGFNGVLNQCETFSLNFTTTVAPNVTAFMPRGGSMTVAPLDSTSGTAIYPPFHGLAREQEVLLLFDDNQGHLQTTKLIPVGGVSSSNTTCLGNNSKMHHQKNSSVLSRAAIIGIAVGASVVSLLAVLILLFFLRSRRRNHQGAKDMEFDPTLLNRRWPPEEKKVSITSYDSPATFAAPMPVLFSGEGYVMDPIYTNEKYSASIRSDARTSISSWNQFVPRDQRSQRTKSWDSSDERTPRGSAFPPRPPSTISTASMNTADVQTILQMATGDRTSGADLTEVPITPQQSTIGGGMVAKPAVARLVSLRRNNRTAESDMPVSAISRNNSTAAAVFAGGPYSYVNFGESDDDMSSTPAVDGHLRGSEPPSQRDRNHIIVR